MKNVIGIDLGGTAIKFALINESGEFLTEGILPTHADVSAEKIVEQLKKSIKIVQDFAKENNIVIDGIGIGTPGIVDAESGTVLGGAENLAGWENIPLAEILHKETQLNVFVDNDANVMGLAETAFGAAKGCTDVVFLTIGTGIGGALIINGKLYGGYKNRGTELGHFPLIANGEQCNCGSVGCFEHYAAAASMVRRYKEKLVAKGLPAGDEINGKYIIDLFHKGDVEAVASVDENCAFIGHAVAGFINIFSPQKVIIGGGLADAGDFYIQKIRENVNKYVMSDCAVNTSVENASLGNRAGCLGAAGLVFS